MIEVLRQGIDGTWELFLDMIGFCGILCIVTFIIMLFLSLVLTMIKAIRRK